MSKGSKFTIVNADSDNIYISKTLLNQLQSQQQQAKESGATGGSEASKASAPPPPPAPQPAQQLYPNLPTSGFPSGDFAYESGKMNDPMKSDSNLAFEPSIFMNGLRGEYERKFHIYQVLSQAKFDELNSLNKEMHKKYGELLAKEVKKVDELYFKKPNVYESPCGAQELMILECYKNNPKQTLRCSGHVKEFAACIDRARLSVLHTNTRK